MLKRDSKIAQQINVSALPNKAKVDLSECLYRDHKNPAYFKQLKNN